jgi:hypothetical protein
MSRYTYELRATDSGYYAKCVEMDVAGEGPTRDAAISALRGAITERMKGDEAVAPPEAPPRVSTIELIAAAAEAPPSPQGPGEAPARN